MRDELTSPYLLYGMPASLYTAKARSYLRKRGVGHVELAAGDPRYTDRVMPAIGRWIIPVLETPSGDLIQDTTEIVDHLEEHLPEHPGVYPETPLQRCVAHVLELFGGEGLLRPAMHYRWDFDEANLAFLAHDFGLALAPGGGAEERRRAFEGAEALMRRATRSVGVTAETAAIVEESYEEFLRLLDSHLATAPYLLGGRPTIADLGFIGPLHAHLARDPYPSALMKRTAGNVWRWVERMNAPVDDTGEYLDLSPALFSDDSVSPTLRDLLAFVGTEFVPEVLAQVAFVDGWLGGHEVGEGDVVGGEPRRRWIGSTAFELRGREVTVAVAPYRIYMLQRLQDSFGGHGEADRTAVRELFGPLGLEPLLDARPSRRVERRDNVEVWGAPQEARRVEP